MGPTNKGAAMWACMRKPAASASSGRSFPRPAMTEAPAVNRHRNGNTQECAVHALVKGEEPSSMS